MKKRLFYFALVLLFALIIFWIYVYATTRKQIFTDSTTLPMAKVAIIFGAGIFGDRPSAYLQDRLDAGIALYREGKVQKLLLTGDNGTDAHDELTVMKTYCAERGIPPAAIYLDYAGFDTYSSIVRAREIFGVTEATLVSQKYHLKRAIYLANHLDIKANGFSANAREYVFYTKNLLREYPALVKSGLDLLFNREPKFLGEKVPIDGASNF